jgi:hypothetical protein
MTNERTFEITDASGTRRVTLAQFRAEQDARKADAAKVMDAVRRGDMAGCAKAQADMRAKWW